MAELADFYASLKALCDELHMLRLSPRPIDADWRHHNRSLDEARAQRETCRKAVAACVRGADGVAGALPDAWRGDDPRQSKYIQLKRSLETVQYWLHDVQRAFRGYKMPLDSDEQDQHDDPADVKSWNEAEGKIRRLGNELRDYIDLQTANAACAAPKPGDAEPPAQADAKPAGIAQVTHDGGQAKASHSADFTFVNWYGTEYTFALGVQSSAVQALWDEWEKTGLGLHQSTIRNAIDAERDSFRMDTAFRGHPAFGTMIQWCGDGKYRLAPPTDNKAAPAPKAKKSAGITSGARRKRV